VAPRISVIVAVYNPGPHFDDLIDSLLRQTLSPDQFEVLLCDDGSDEETQARLDAVTAAHPHLKVIKLAHSGWPGTPRNVGIDIAAGKYVFFCDHDDTFGDEALQRLVDYADANNSDVVVGKLTGAGRNLPRGIFRQNIPNAVLGRDPLLEILTPHKLFRTEFIREHAIRFPDGRVRLEDHMFVMKAYFAADVISILADYPCYYWTRRTDKPSASASLIEPEHYYHYLGVVLDIVEENVEPGPDRDALLQHWYRGKVLKRLAGRNLLRYTDEYRTELLDVVRPFVLKRFGPEVDRYLAFPQRIRSALLRADRVDGLQSLAEIESELKASAQVTSIGWDENGRLRLEIEAKAFFEDGSELVFEPSPAAAGAESGWRWRPPRSFAPEVVTDELLEAGPDLAASRLEVFARARHDGSDYVQPVEDPAPQEGPGALRTTIVLDPRTARAGRAVTKDTDLVAQVTYAGWNFGTSVRIDPELLAAADLPERIIGRRAFTVGTRGSNRIFLRARRLPPIPKPVPVAVVAKVPPAFGVRAARKARRVLGRARRRLLRIMR
jgi:poly(ribitol-phosphate) beta-N-acetylglucosaminyltransferase